MIAIEGRLITMIRVIAMTMIMTMVITIATVKKKFVAMVITRRTINIAAMRRR